MNIFKRTLTVLLGVSFAFAMMGCGAATQEAAADESTEKSVSIANESTEKTVGIANPFVTVDSLDAAAEIAGFSMEAPDTLDGYTGRKIQAIDKNLIQVIYGDLDNNVYYRKAIGTEDVSGDYNKYEKVETKNIYGKELTIKSDGEKTYVIIWTDGAYSYAIQSNQGFDFSAVEVLLAIN